MTLWIHQLGIYVGRYASENEMQNLSNACNASGKALGFYLHNDTRLLCILMKTKREDPTSTGPRIVICLPVEKSGEPGSKHGLEYTQRKSLYIPVMPEKIFSVIVVIISEDDDST